ncbi:MAG TPA: phage tail protein [Pyrinomonadaceae bacterium]|nr:phage tail protein [Pyrinomonadaceae bacterium]
MPSTAGRNDPFLAFRFEVRVGPLAVAGFSDCTGLQLETEVQDYSEGGLNTNLLKFPTRTKQTNLVLKRGIVDRLMWEWYFALTQGFVQRLSGEVVVHDPSGESDVIIWHFREAFPSKWQGPELSATQNNVAVETVEICHEGLFRIK